MFLDPETDFIHNHSGCRALDAAIFSSNASMRAKPPFAPSSTPYCMVVSRCSVVSKRIVSVSFVCSPRSSNSSVVGGASRVAPPQGRDHLSVLPAVL